MGVSQINLEIGEALDQRRFAVVPPGYNSGDLH
jgi:hypothetical protein